MEVTIMIDNDELEDDTEENEVYDTSDDSEEEDD